MASLTGQNIKDTYQSLLKTDDNGLITNVSKNITDGSGSASGLYLKTDGVLLSGSVIVEGTLEATASFALTASYALNGGGGVSVDTSSFATTGSNNFIGNQTISGSISFGDGSLVQSLSASSGDGNGYTTLEIKPDISLGSDQYVVLDPTAPNHIHIRAGGTIDQSNADLYIGGEKRNIIVSDSSQGVFINAEREQYITDYTFTTGSGFSTAEWATDGFGNHVITINDPTQEVYDAVVNSFSPSIVEVLIDGNPTQLTVNGTGTPGLPAPATITVLEAPPANPTEVNWIYFEIRETRNSEIDLDSDINIRASDDLRLYSNDRFRLLNYAVDEAIEITTNYDNNDKTWYFGADGKLIMPGSLEQGENVLATGSYSHAEGLQTIASGSFSHAEGSGTQAIGEASHAEGGGTQAIGLYSHAEGASTQAIGAFSHAEGESTQAIGLYSHAEGASTQAIGLYSHAEGAYTLAIGEASHAEGQGTQAIGLASHAEGNYTIASGSYSHAEGDNTQAIGVASHAEGVGTQAIGDYSHAEGYYTIAPGSYSHAEGAETLAIGDFSHAEGQSTQAVGYTSHAQGANTQATGEASHAEGEGTQAIGYASHAEGSNTQAIGYASHAEGANTRAIGSYSHAEGYQTIASGSYQSVIGQFNVSSSAQSAFIIGNGANDNNRSNLLFASGSQVQVTGSLDVSGSLLLNGASVARPYKTYTAYYNVEENILQTYEDTILGGINFEYTPSTNILSVVSTSGSFGTVDSGGIPTKCYVSLTTVNGLVDALRANPASPYLIVISDNTGTPGNMSNYSLKFFLEIRVYD